MTQSRHSITKEPRKTCKQIKSTQSLLSNLIYKTKTMKIGTSRIINIIGELTFVFVKTCFVFQVLLHRIPFLDFPILDAWLGDCGIPISI